MISCQFSIYPLGVQDLGPAIDAAVAELRGAGLVVEVGAMSSYVTGDYEVVFDGLRRACDAAASREQVVMTATFSNACPIL